MLLVVVRILLIVRVHGAEPAGAPLDSTYSRNAAFQSETSGRNR